MSTNKTTLKILLLTSLIGTALSSSNLYKSKNVTITWDIDDVVLQRDKSINTHLWNNRGAIAYHMFNVPFVWKTLQLKYNGASSQEYKELCEKKAPQLAAMIHDIKYEKKIISGTPKLIKDLKKRGCTQRAATNMSSNDFEFYKEKFPRTFGTFETHKAVPDTVRIKKPDPRYFEQYFDSVPEDHDKLTVFFDDKEKNVQAFEAVGKKRGLKVKGIVFKNPQQARRELEGLKILIPNTHSPVAGPSGQPA